MSDDDGAWFAPKRYGYGAGLPVTWQGWLVLVGYLGLLVGATFLLPRHVALYLAIVVVATLVFFAVTASRTRGGWRWRWGADDAR